MALINQLQRLTITLLDGIRQHQGRIHSENFWRQQEKAFLEKQSPWLTHIFLLFGFITVNADGEIIICLSWPENFEVVKDNLSSRQLRLDWMPCKSNL